MSIDQSRLIAKLMAAMLIATVAISGCGRPLPAMLWGNNDQGNTRATATLTLTPEVVEGGPASYRTQEVVETYKRSDIHQLVIKLYERTDNAEFPVFDSQGLHVRAIVPAGDLGKQVTLNGLGVDTRYRVRVQAIKLTGSDLQQISDDELSFVDIYVGRDDRAVTGGLRVWLGAVPFSADGQSEFSIGDGTYRASGSVNVDQSQSLVFQSNSIIQSGELIKPPGAIGWEANLQEGTSKPIDLENPARYEGVSVEFIGAFVPQGEESPKELRWRAFSPAGTMVIRKQLSPAERALDWRLEMANMPTTQADSSNQLLMEVINTHVKASINSFDLGSSGYRIQSPTTCSLSLSVSSTIAGLSALFINLGALSALTHAEVSQSAAFYLSHQRIPGSFPVPPDKIGVSPAGLAAAVASAVTAALVAAIMEYLKCMRDNSATVRVNAIVPAGDKFELVHNFITPVDARFLRPIKWGSTKLYTLVAPSIGTLQFYFGDTSNWQILVLDHELVPGDVAPEDIDVGKYLPITVRLGNSI
jgi:hypothetical protein